jgi:hypothetical protein
LDPLQRRGPLLLLLPSEHRLLLLLQKLTLLDAVCRTIAPGHLMHREGFARRRRKCSRHLLHELLAVLDAATRTISTSITSTTHRGSQQGFHL